MCPFSFLNFENVAMRRKPEDKNAVELLAILESQTFLIVCDGFTREVVITEENMTLNVFRSAFIEEFKKKK